MKYIEITHYFYSNCFFEAIKAKLKNPNKVKLTIVPKGEAGVPHFLWSDGEYDYDFGVEKYLEWWQIPLFKGCIRRRNLGFNENYKKRMELVHNAKRQNKNVDKELYNENN